MQEQIASIDSEELTAQQANEEYGVEGELEFKESISRGAAELRFNKHQKYLYNKRVHDIADNDNSFVDNTVNTLAFMGAATFLDPTTYLFSPTKGIGLLANTLKGIKGLSEIPIATKALELAERNLINPNLFGGAVKTGIIRGFVDESITQGLTEVALYDRAQKYGYDYDVLLGIAAVTFGGALRSVGEVAEGIKLSKQGSVIDHLFDMDNYTSTKVLSKKTFNNLVTRVADDISAGKVTDFRTIQAAMKLDTELNLTQAYQKDLFQGLDNLLTGAEVETLRRQDLFNVKARLNMYRAFQNTGVLDRSVRSLDEIPVPSKFQGVEIKSLEKVNKLLDENTELLTKFGEQQSRLGEAIRKQDEFLKATKNRLIKDKIDKLYNRAESEGFPNGKTLTEMTLEELKENYNILKEKLKNARTKQGFDSFLKKKNKTQLDIVNLHRLIDPETNRFTLEDLLNLNADDLKAVHAKRKYKQEAVNAITEKEARAVIAEYAKDPREVQFLEFLEAETKFKETKIKAEAERKALEAEAETRVEEFKKPKEEKAKIEGEVKNTDPIAEKYNIPKDVQELAEYKKTNDIYTQAKKHARGLLEGVSCLLGN